MKYADIQVPARRQPDRRQVHARRQAVPAEDPQPDERRLQSERGQALDRQRRTEHAADELGVHRPVHPELELLHQPGRHPIAKLMSSSVPKNFVSRSQASTPSGTTRSA
jgi:hypothetical protein